MSSYIENLAESMAVLKADTQAGWEECWRQSTGILEAARIVPPEEDNCGQLVVKAWHRISPAPRQRVLRPWVKMAGYAVVVAACYLVLVLWLL